MQTKKIFFAGILGTSAMTLFSYLVSKRKNKNFREPELLGQLIERLPNKPSNLSAQIAGWGIHYAIGISFMACYSEIWERTGIKPTLASGTFLGVANGVVVVTGWKLMFEAHPNPPAKELKPFFGHLLLAHIVFGVFNAIGYKSTMRIKESGSL